VQLNGYVMERDGLCCDLNVLWIKNCINNIIGKDAQCGIEIVFHLGNIFIKTYYVNISLIGFVINTNFKEPKKMKILKKRPSSHYRFSVSSDLIILNTFVKLEYFYGSIL